MNAPEGEAPATPPRPEAPAPPASSPFANPGPFAVPDPVGAGEGQAAFGVPGGGAGGQGAQADAPADLALTGMNVLNANAATLFALVSRIRGRVQEMDVERLRQAAIAEIRDFETRSIQSGVDPQKVRVARYAICATIDDVVLNTPWGGQSDWAQKSLVGTFNKETVSGDRFYDLLKRLQQNPGQNLDLLEFVYMCLSLGFEGRLRVERGGPEKHLAIRQGLAKVIRNNRGAAEPEFAPHWKGETVPFRARNMWLPVWVTMGVLAGLMVVTFFGLSWALSGGSERLTGELAAIDSGAPPSLDRPAPPPPPPPPPPPEAEPTQVERVSGFLQEEIEAGLVRVFEDANTVTVRIVGTGMFAPASDTLQERFQVPIERVAEALNEEPGNVIIAGHSDSIPINTARFPSNLHLSLARARSVMAEMAQYIEDPDRLSAEGRSDREPIASNETREGRAANRRIEVILVKQSES